MAEIAKKLYYKKNEVEYSINLYDSTTDVGPNYLTVKVDNNLAYAKCGPFDDMVASDLTVKMSDTIYAVLSSNLVDLPSGYIAMFESSCPSGWTRETAFDNSFLRGASTYGGTGGGDTHTHSYTTGNVNTSTFNANNQQVKNTVTYSYTGNHYHYKTIEADSTETSSLPPYLNIVFCRKD
jgi:hypothetical protein